MNAKPANLFVRRTTSRPQSGLSSRCSQWASPRLVLSRQSLMNLRLKCAEYSGNFLSPFLPLTTLFNVDNENSLSLRQRQLDANFRRTLSKSVKVCSSFFHMPAYAIANVWVQISLFGEQYSCWVSIIEVYESRIKPKERTKIKMLHNVIKIYLLLSTVRF